MPGFKIQVVEVDENGVESDRRDISDEKFETKEEALKALGAERWRLTTGEKPENASEIEDDSFEILDGYGRPSQRYEIVPT